MSDLARFYAYARAFEEAVLADDWSRIEPCLSPDAGHRVEGPPLFACDDRGRAEVVAGLAASVARIERRCDARIPEVIAGPELRPDGIWMRFGVGLRREGLPDLWFEGDHLVRMQGGRIARIDERMDPATAGAAERWFADHSAALHPPGTRTPPRDPAHLDAMGRSLRRSLVRMYAAAKSARDVDAALALCAEDFELDAVGFGLATRDREQAGRQLALFFRSFPDYAFETEALAGNATSVVAWGRARMTFGGELFGIAPTQRRADLPAVSVFDFEGGLLRRERFHLDLAGLCEQIGAPVERVTAALAGLRREAT